MALVAEYGFNEGSGTTAADSSGNAKTLTINSGSWSGTAITGHFASTTAIYASQPAQGTIMCKARFASAPNDTALLGSSVATAGDSNWRGAFFGTDSGKVAFWVYDGGSSANRVGGASTVDSTDTTYHHWAFTWSASGVSVYCDGTLIGSSTSMTSMWSLTSILLGAMPHPYVGGTAMWTLTGVVDDLRFFNSALSPGEIAAWMNAPLGRGTLVAEYGFSEGSGTSSVDTSGNGYNAVIGSGQWQTGHTGSGVQSNTINDTPYIPNLGSSGTITNYTWMFWIYRTGTVGSYGQVIYDSANFWFELWNTNVLSVNVGIQTPPLDLNTWTHIALTRSGNTYTFFVNGTSVATNTTNNTDYDIDRSRPWCIGTGGDGPFPGVMDEVRLFDSALSAAEITTWMNTPVGSSLTPLGWII